nr:hypothetical protein [Tanacetum cinerariifolium]
MELFNGNGIDKIMNGVGKPLLMDNMTKERCLKKSGKLDFARVLVEVSANDVLPSSLEISYPPIGILLCLVRKPRTKEEIAAKNLRDAFKIRKHVVDDSGNNNVDDEGFTVIGKKNRHAAPQINVRLSKGGGTSMDYRVVRGNLMRMWRIFDIKDITKTNSSVFYFKFKSEDEPPVIPIWVCVYNILMELFNGNGIDKIMNGVGKPLLMDNMTKERCLKKSGKLDFARVLVEVSANDVLPSSLEISYPPIGRPAKVGVLDVKYQWKPPLCTHCKTFRHTTLSCKEA